MSEETPRKSAIALEAVRAEDGAYSIDIDAAIARPIKRQTGNLILMPTLGALALLGAVLFGIAKFSVVDFIPSLGQPTAEKTSDAAEAWSTLDRSNPAALRAFIEQYGARSETAKAALAALDRAAWTNASAPAPSLDEALNKLDAYDLAFPAGERANDAQKVRDDLRAMIQSVEDSLKHQGFDPGGIDGVVTPETTEAVRRYQASLRIPMTGVVTADLARQLRATDLSTPIEAAKAASQTPSKVASAEPFRDCFVCPEMIWLPRGAAIIGDAGGFAGADERPAHEVKISYGLAVGRYEVTFDEWDACVADGGCSDAPSDQGWGRGARPVINVTWADANAYAVWLSRKTGNPYRLLSEAEWEYAARAGASTAYSFGDDPAALCSYANHADASTDYRWKNISCTDGFGKQTSPVGKFKANAFGLFDTHGNVWEWVADCWHNSYQGAPANGAAWMLDCDNAGRILRGGSWSVQASNLRASYRYTFDPNGRTPFFGFRVGRTM